MKSFCPSTSNVVVMWFASLRNFCFACPSVPHATAVKVLHCAEGLCTLLHIPHCHSVFESFAKRNTRTTDVATNSHRAVTLCEPWPLWFSPSPICPSDCRGACPTGWHQSQQMVPVQSRCSQCPRDPRLHCAQQTLPLLQRSVYALMHVCVCGLALWLSSCLTSTVLHLLRLRPWNRWSIWEQILKPDLTSYMTIGRLRDEDSDKIFLSLNLWNCVLLLDKQTKKKPMFYSPEVYTSHLFFKD